MTTSCLLDNMRPPKLVNVITFSILVYLILYMYTTCRQSRFQEHEVSNNPYLSIKSTQQTEKPGPIVEVTSYMPTVIGQSGQQQLPNKPEDNSTIYTALGYLSYDTLEEEIFEPMGLETVDSKSLIAKLKYTNPTSCDKVFAEWLDLSSSYDASATPPREIPGKFKFTLEGYAHLKMSYENERSVSRISTWRKKRIDKLISTPLVDFKPFARNYWDSGLAMYYAMKYHVVKDLSGAVVGSLTPWVESFALRNSAKQVTTIEYMNIRIVGTDRIKYIHPIELAKNADKYFGKFQFIASYSSLEHSGLGRYGDAPDPIGDLREMLKIRCLIEDGGLLFLGIPVGPDALEWNLHRIYGRIRLAIMFAGFELLSIFEKENPAPIELREADFGPNVTLFQWWRQPVFVLKKI